MPGTPAPGGGGRRRSPRAAIDREPGDHAVGQLAVLGITYVEQHGDRTAPTISDHHDGDRREDEATAHRGQSLGDVEPVAIRTRPRRFGARIEPESDAADGDDLRRRIGVVEDLASQRRGVGVERARRSPPVLVPHRTHDVFAFERHRPADASGVRAGRTPWSSTRSRSARRRRSRSIDERRRRVRSRRPRVAPAQRTCEAWSAIRSRAESGRRVRRAGTASRRSRRRRR